jgi:hypothetical protein
VGARKAEWEARTTAQSPGPVEPITDTQKGRRDSSPSATTLEDGETFQNGYTDLDAMFDDSFW